LNLLATHGPWIAAALITGLVIAFLMTKAIHRAGKRKKADAHELEKRAYVRGVNYILENDHDAAIEELTKVVQINSETVEIYFALGNLFRRKGEIDRAIRIHQNIILRPGLDEKTQMQAYFNLAMDYKKAGFVKRAVATFEEVLSKDRNNRDVMSELAELYEEIKDWEQAFSIRQRLAKAGGHKEDNVLAHLQAELGRQKMKENALSSAKKCFKKALSIDPACIDAMLSMGELHLDEGDVRAAIAAWTRIMRVAPQFANLVFSRLEQAYERLGRSETLEKTLREVLVKHDKDPNAHFILGRYLYKKGDPVGAIAELRKAVELNPTSLEARKSLGTALLAENRINEALDEYRSLLDRLDQGRKTYQCAKCGLETNEMLWKCPQCRSWDTIRAVAPPEPRPLSNSEETANNTKMAKSEDASTFA